MGPVLRRYNMYRGWTQTDYQNKHYNINQKDEETSDDRGRDGGTNFILSINEQETCLTLQEHDDDDDDSCCLLYFSKLLGSSSRRQLYMQYSKLYMQMSEEYGG